MLSSANSLRFSSKVMLFNTSARNRNTMKLLNEVKKGAESKGANVEMVDLFHLGFKGCGSCLLCKKIGAPAKCYQKDKLSPYLEKVAKCDGFAIGTPIYMGNFSSTFYAFLERLAYSNMRYEPGDRFVKFGKRIPTGLVISLGADENAYKNVYSKTLGHNADVISSIFGPCTTVVNVSQALVPSVKSYEMGMFDMDKINKWVKEHDPIVLKQAYDLGVKLASK